MFRIYFWQTMLTPHMTALALSLSKNGYEIFYIAQSSLSKNRLELGWKTHDLQNIKVCIVTSTINAKSIILNSPSNSIHICQGLRNNGIISYVQKELKKKKLRQWLIIETIRDYGFLGLLRKIVYKFLFTLYGNNIEAILAIGWKTPTYLSEVGLNPKKIFPFSYFLQSPINLDFKTKAQDAPFRFIFVGSLVPGKNLDLLINALYKLRNYKFELIVIGDGPCKKKWKKYADDLIPNRTSWKGIIKMSEIYKFISQTNCLVLPSKHDGWGVVVSESLIAGVPAICSDACGVAEVVKASNFGGVFQSGNVNELVKKIRIVLKKGPLEENEKYKLSSWSKKITSDVGADYLVKIINYINGSSERPTTPWIKSQIDLKN
jgi:glycosyltransferase involved in cell wall biosynthesis